jgi:hypothetical protein
MRLLASGAAVPPRMGVSGFKQVPGSAVFLAVVGSTDAGEAQFVTIGQGWRWDGLGPDGRCH